MTERDFAAKLTAGVVDIAPLEVRWVCIEDHRGRAPCMDPTLAVRPVDAILDVTWRGETCRFAVEMKGDSKPQSLLLASQQIKRAVRSGDGEYPMVIAPYLSQEKLLQLLGEGVSAMDLCGNVAIDVPGRLHFFRTGRPNLYPDRSSLRSAYRGDSSLVARTLLLQPQFAAIGDILEMIRRLGGSLTIGTVSKSLKMLESDLVVERLDRRAVRLIQPGRLLDRLRDAYCEPKVLDVWEGKVLLPSPQLIAELRVAAKEGDLIRTGESSAAEYAAYAADPIMACYCRTEPARVLETLGAEWREGQPFANLRLIHTRDQRVYFDPRPGLACSPIQAWLEMASGDMRQKQVAEQIRQRLLNSVGLQP